MKGRRTKGGEHFRGVPGRAALAQSAAEEPLNTHVPDSDHDVIADPERLRQLDLAVLND